VKTFLGSLGADSEQILMKTCEHYMEAPVTAQSQDTLTFCAIAVDTAA
jgi:hypothetical protein